MGPYNLLGLNSATMVYYSSCVRTEHDSLLRGLVQTDNASKALVALSSGFIFLNIEINMGTPHGHNVHVATVL
jgi:hypothetical protein